MLPFQILLVNSSINLVKRKFPYRIWVAMNHLTNKKYTMTFWYVRLKFGFDRKHFFITILFEILLDLLALKYPRLCLPFYWTKKHEGHIWCKIINLLHFLVNFIAFYFLCCNKISFFEFNERKKVQLLLLIIALSSQWR